MILLTIAAVIDLAAALPQHEETRRFELDRRDNTSISNNSISGPTHQDFYLDCLEAIRDLPNDKPGVQLPADFHYGHSMFHIYLLPKVSSHLTCGAQASIAEGQHDLSTWRDIKYALGNVNEEDLKKESFGVSQKVGARGLITVTLFITDQAPQPQPPTPPPQ